TLAEVLKMEPEWGALPANIPPRIRDLLQRCLRKDPRQRLQAIGDARIAIDEALSGAPEAGTFAAQPDTYEKIGERLAWGTAVLLGLLAALLGIGYVARAPVPTAATVAEIPSPKDENFALAGLSAAPPVVSPDGKRLAFGAIGKDGKQLLWVRALNGTTAQPLAGTDGATFPFWSPDSRQLGYFADGKLNRIDVAGGPPFSICDTSGVGRGGSWGSDGTILFAPTFNSGLFRVPSSGGTPQPVTKVGSIAHEASHRWPQLLPDGKHFLFFSFGASSENSGTYLSSLDGGEPRLILRVSSSAVFVPPGYLLFVLDGALMAQQFDAESLRLTGASVPLTSQTLANPILRNGIFSASDNGVLVYETGESATANQILWLDRTGKALGTTGPPGEYAGPQISPDGHRLAISLTTLGVPNFDIWVYDILRGRSTRLTFNLAADVAPAWSPDGKTVAFTSSRKGAFSIYEKAADGSGETEPLFVDDASEDNSSWSSDGRYLLFDRVPTNSSASAIWALPLFGDRKPRIVVESGFGVNEPALSPNGKWLAYRSVDESGLPEIYVMPFPSGGGKWQVSTNGGNYPRWRRDSKELYFLSLDSKIVAASIAEQGTSIAIGNVKPLFSVNIAPGISPGNPFDVSADGLKFVVVSQAGLQAPPPLTLVTNWPALLKKQ
ncbi:MAG TPA: hypothetical protein VE077_15870, partial [Candidatus Methylomirabilis sp.]|nr:hypothetical protein [Candidatus Methylomirabilis sp.]